MRDIQGCGAADQCNQQTCHQEPHQRYDQFGPDEFMDADRQREHQIALVFEQVAVKAVDHDDHRHHRRRDDRRTVGKHDKSQKHPKCRNI